MLWQQPPARSNTDISPAFRLGPVTSTFPSGTIPEVMAGGTNGDACVRDAYARRWLRLDVARDLRAARLARVHWRTTVPTAAPGTNNNQAASTAFVTAALRHGIDPATSAVPYNAANFVGTGGMTWTVGCRQSTPVQLSATA